MKITPEMIGYSAAFLTTFSFLPQVILTVKTKDTKSLSLGMYSLLTLGIFLWMVYGIVKEDRVLIIANSVTLVLAGIILSIKIHNKYFGK